MKVLWHEDMSVNHKAKPAAGFFRDFQDKVTAFGGAQLGLTVVAGDNKMQLAAPGCHSGDEVLGSPDQSRSRGSRLM